LILQKFTSSFQTVAADLELKRIMEERSQIRRSGSQIKLMQDINSGGAKLKALPSPGTKRVKEDIGTGNVDRIQADLAELRIYASKIEKERKLQKKRLDQEAF